MCGQEESDASLPTFFFAEVSELQKKTPYKHELIRMTSEAPLVLPLEDATPAAPSFAEQNDCANLALIESKCLDYFEFKRPSFNMPRIAWDFVVQINERWEQCWENSPVLDEAASAPSSGFSRIPQCRGETTLARMFVACRFAQVRECHNAACARRRQALKLAVPNCQWPALVDLVLTILACWMPNFLVVLLQFQFIAVKGRESHSGNISPRSMCLDLGGMVEILRWAIRVAYGREMLLSTQDDLFYSTYFLGNSEELATLLTSNVKQLYGQCPSRLWNLSLLAPRGVDDIPHLMYMMAKLTFKQPNRHRDCTEQCCLFNNYNTTRVQQAHKCATGDCGEEFIFPSKLLDMAFSTTGVSALQDNSWASTAWELSDNVPTLCSSAKRYMAISHVWCDGTGIGLKNPGQVNTCLVNYFLHIAHQEGCQGIWWDTISIPMERAARKKAIDRMLKNYEMAAITLVHDQELLNFEWKDDGSPAVALVLSSWFTRGWTAAELLASRAHPVKVLFKDPDNPAGLPLAKDLDHDILAWDSHTIGMAYIESDKNAMKPGYGGVNFHRRQNILESLGVVPKQGHFIATDIIKRFRPSEIPSNPLVGNLVISTDEPGRSTIWDLLALLQARTTSWAKDRLLIPALMCLPPSEMDSNATGPQLTKKLLSQFKSIHADDLFHGEVPITNCGRWSWCPPSIFDLGILRRSVGRYLHPSTFCFVSRHGSLEGTFIPLSVTNEDVIIPFGTHPAVTARISKALSDRKRCLLLADIYNHTHRQYILAIPVSIGIENTTKQVVISCRWVGGVYLGHPLALGAKNPGNLNNCMPRAQLPEARILFGHDAYSNGIELPGVTISSVFELSSQFVDVYRRSKWDWDKRAFMWYLSDGQDSNGKEEAPHYVLQPVCLYPNDIPEATNEEEALIMPSCTAKFDFDSNIDKIDLSFVQSLAPWIRDSICQCEVDHSSTACQGTVKIAWSFPYNLERNPKGITLRRIFRSLFHIVRTPSYANGLIVGRETFSRHIQPHLRYAPISIPFHDIKQGDIFIYASVEEAVADGVDWYKPMEVISINQPDSRCAVFQAGNSAGVEN